MVFGHPLKKRMTWHASSWALVVCCCWVCTAQPPPPLPLAWDLPRMYPNCSAWVPYDENATGCASCCPLALAAALSARECLRDGRNTRLSGQQLWDCAGGSFSSCAAGTSLNDMVRALGSGPYAGYALLPDNCSAPARLSAPNATTCLERYAACARGVSFFQNPQVHDTLGYTVDGIYFSGSGGSEVVLPGASAGADDALMREIFARGPVVSVLVLAKSDMDAFLLQPWPGPNYVFVPKVWPLADAVGEEEVRAHCLSVVGWGIDHFIVQNSYTAAWGRGGFGRILRGAGLLGSMWQAPSTGARRPCTQGPPQCVPGYGGGYPPPLPLSSSATTSAAAATTPPPMVAGDAVVPMMMMAPVISNGAIIGVALASAAVIAAVAAWWFLLLPPAGPGAAPPP